MVEVDVLACLDYLVWLRTGEEVSKRLTLNQSTISRNLAKCCDRFSLIPHKVESEYSISGELDLLNLERKVHQRHRWMGGRPLRIEGMFWSGRTYLSQPIEGFTAGNHDFMAVCQPLSLLREAVIDAWIAPYPDCPDEDDPEIASFPLCRFPCILVASESHPLFSIQKELTIDDIAAYPSLSLPDGAFPIFEAYARSIGLWNSPSRILRYKTEMWEGKTEDELTTSFSDIFALDMFPIRQRILPVKLEQEFADVLVIRREYANHPRFKVLKATLLERLRPWVEKYPEIHLCE
ncbi:substrate-binding domain-containing protein [Synechococcus sp. CS-1330]|nr:substrate-binding domain-containing protein [Synechococcus sp. CS-1330]